MPDKKCPNCGLWSTGSAIYYDCGYSFEKEIMEESKYKQPLPQEIKQHKNWLLLFGQGATSGSISVLMVMALIFQIISDGFKDEPSLLGYVVIMAVVLGLPVGGIGGLILGKIWKNDWAAFLGGIASLAILCPLVIAVPCLIGICQ